MTTLPQTAPAAGWRALPTVRRAARRALERNELLFFGLHVPLGVAIRTVPNFGLLHGLTALAVGLFWSLSPRTLPRTFLAAGYIAGSEVLWRMSGGSVVYEFGKYAIALLAIAAFLQMPRRRSPRVLAAIYLVMLVPGAFLTLNAIGFNTQARSEISFNLSGPIALGLCVLAISVAPPGFIPLRRMMVAIGAPIIGVATLASRSTIRAAEIQFSTSSNFVTSGGFGPNQVSAVLGLGAVISLLLAFQAHNRLVRVGFLALTAGQLVQATLTFSRGGVINAILCIGILSIHMLRQPRVRIALIFTLALSAVLAQTVLLPALEKFTGGALSQRYGDLDPGLRRSLAEAELQIWYDNFVLGVGPGMAKYHRADTFIKRIAAHTEYTRLLAEHGVLGLVCLLILMAIPIHAYFRAPTSMTKAWVAMTAGWALLEMLHAAMRISAISLVFALCAIRWARPAAPSRPRPDA